MSPRAKLKEEKMDLGLPGMNKSHRDEHDGDELKALLAKLKTPMKTNVNMSSSSSSSNSSSSSADEDGIFYCRICNKKVNGTTDGKPTNEVCKPCVKNFPERMFCKSCKRYFPNAEPFGKTKDRCNFCHEKLQLRREARKKKAADSFPEGSPEKKKRKQKIEDEEETNTGNYVAVYIKGKCVAKKTLNI